MANIAHLPNELLLQIFNYVDLRFAQPSFARFQLYAVLAQTCKAFRPIAETFLYQQVDVLLPYQFSSTGPESLALLIRTLLDRPDLRKYIVQVRVPVLRRYTNHRRTCASYETRNRATCGCGWEEIRVAVFDEWTSPCFPDWSEELWDGWEPCLLAFLFTLTPNLNDVEIEHFQGSYDEHGWEHFTPGTLDVANAFGLNNNQSRINLDVFVGLKNITVLRLNGTIPWPFLLLPNLRQVELNLWKQEEESFQWARLSGGASNPAITTLIINAYHNVMNDAVEDHVNSLLDGGITLPSLQRVHACIKHSESKAILVDKDYACTGRFNFWSILYDIYSAVWDIYSAIWPH